MSVNLKVLKISAICSLGFASLFGAFSLIFHYGDWRRLVFVFSIGLFIGLVAAPEIEPKAFKMASLFQLFCGAISGILVGLVLNLVPLNIVATAILGGFLGLTASFWAKYVPIP